MRFYLKNKINIYRILGLTLILLLSLTFFFSNSNENVSFATSVEIVINKDTSYHILADSIEIRDIALNKLDSIDEQKALLDELNELYVDGYNLKLGEGFYSIQIASNIENENLEYGQVIPIKGSIINDFNIQEKTNESYNWYYKYKQKDWVVDDLEKTDTYSFGIDFNQKLQSGDYKVKGALDATFIFGGQKFSTKINSNELPIEILPTNDYEVYVPDKFYTYYQTVINGESQQLKLKDIKMNPLDSSDFYNGNGVWSLSKKEDGNRLLNQGLNNVKLTFTPNNTSLLPRDFDVIICGVNKTIEVIIDNQTCFEDEDYVLRYETVLGLEGTDTPESIGLELFLVDNKDGRRLRDEEIKPNNSYNIGGSINVDRYRVLYKYKNSDQISDIRIIPATLTILTKTIENSIRGGNVQITKPEGFLINSKVDIYDMEKTVPENIIKEGHYLYTVTGFKFTDRVWNSIYGGYEDITIDSGNVHIKYVNNDQSIKYIAYLDDEGWHTVDFTDNMCEFNVNNFKAIALFKVYDNELNWLSILMTVILGLNLGIMIILLVKRFGGKRK